VQYKQVGGREAGLRDLPAALGCLKAQLGLRFRAHRYHPLCTSVCFSLPEIKISSKASAKRWS